MPALRNESKTQHGKGYRFLPPVAASAVAPGGQSGGEPSDAAFRKPSRTLQASRRWMWLAMPIFLVVGGFRFWQSGRPDGKDDAAQVGKAIHRIAVLPFTVEGGDPWMGFAMSSRQADVLGNAQGLFLAGSDVASAIAEDQMLSGAGRPGEGHQALAGRNGRRSTFRKGGGDTILVRCARREMGASSGPSHRNWQMAQTAGLIDLADNLQPVARTEAEQRVAVRYDGGSWLRRFALSAAWHCACKRWCKGDARPAYRLLLPNRVDSSQGADVRKAGAGSGNRTRITSLEGWGFTTKLYPRFSRVRAMPPAWLFRQAPSFGTGGDVAALGVPLVRAGEPVVAFAVGVAAGSGGAIEISTLRFCARPSSFGSPSGNAFGATGFCSPKAITSMRLSSTPRSTSQAATSSALAREARRFARSLPPVSV